ncbi:MAG: DUF4307 domain-containing protein [Arachnia sp.]
MSLTPQDKARIERRYPNRRAGDRGVAILAGVVLLAAVAIVVWAGIVNSNPPVAAMVRSFDVTSPEATSAEIVIQRSDPSQAAECFVYAQAVSFERVGEMTLEVPPGEKELTVVTIEVKTVKEATSLSVTDCRIIGS